MKESTLRDPFTESHRRDRRSWRKELTTFQESGWYVVKGMYRIAEETIYS